MALLIQQPLFWGGRTGPEGAAFAGCPLRESIEEERSDFIIPAGRCTQVAEQGQIAGVRNVIVVGSCIGATLLGLDVGLQCFREGKARGNTTQNAARSPRGEAGRRAA